MTSDNTPNCPKCSKKMILRNGRNNSQFWGCSQYPKCKGTRSYYKKSEPVQKRELKSIDKPNDRQQVIFKFVEELLSKNYVEITGEDFVKYQYSHLQINAGAGTGKTTTEEHLVGLIKKYQPDAKIVCLVFNKHVEVEATSKGLPAKTTHSFYYSQLRNNSKTKIQIDDKKVVTIIKSLIQDTWDEDKYFISPVSNLVGKVKNTCAPTTDESLEKLAERFNIELNGSQDRIFELTRLTLNENNKMTNVVDFDDMLYLTWKSKCPIEQHDWVLIDEAQDFNRVQIELAKRTVKDDGHIVIVGDTNQSMYGFRGADLEAMDRFGSAFTAHNLPLDITYRCPKSHVELVNREFPYISFIAHDEAKEGEIKTVSSDKFLGTVKDGDLVLCRTNAPLVSYVFSLIRRGQKAIIRGRDIGDGLVVLIEKFNEPLVNNLIDKLLEYQEKEVYKLLKKEKNSAAQSLQDKVETILVLTEGCDYTSEVIQKIDEIFSDKKEGVVFSTVHKAKGDEADNVYILKYELMPHPMATSDWELQQEMNIKYVALTRAKKTLTFVGIGPGEYIEQEIPEEELNVALNKIEEITGQPIEKAYIGVEFTEKGITVEKEIIRSEVKEIPKCPF